MDYSKTLNLPETEFPMRGNLPKREPEFLKFWEENRIYEKKQKLHEGHTKWTKAPAACPVCAHPQSFFEVTAENY